MSRAPGEDLPALISVLTKSERRYVKLELQRHQIGDGNQSALLFDAFVKGLTESDIKKRYANHGFVKRLPEAKRELMQMILRAMRQFHAERSPIRRTMTRIVDSLFLMRRGQLRWAERLLNEAISEAELVHHDALIALALHTVMELRRHRDDHIEPSTSSSGDALVKAAEALRESAHVDGLLNRMQTIVSRYGRSTDPVAKALANDIVSEGEKLFPLSSLSAQSSWLRLLSQKAFFIDNSPEQSLKYDRSRLAVIERDERYRLANIHHWINLTHSVALRLIVTQDLASAKPLRDKLRSYWLNDAQSVSPLNKRAAVGQYINVELLLAVQEMALFDFKSTMPHILSLLNYHEEEGRTETGIACWFNLGLLDFAYGRYRAAIRYLNEIDEFKEGMREDIKRASVYLRIICHIELGHDTVVESMIRRQRRLTKQTTLPPDEEVFISVASKFLMLRPGKQQYEFLHKALNELADEGSLIGRAGITEIFGFVPWIHSKLQDKPWREIISAAAADRSL